MEMDNSVDGSWKQSDLATERSDRLVRLASKEVPVFGPGIIDGGTYRRFFENDRSYLDLSQPRGVETSPSGSPGTSPRTSGAPAKASRTPAWAQPILDLLERTSFEDMQLSTHIKWLHTDNSIREALDFLREQGVTGAPVFKGDDALGMFELFDVVAAAVRRARPSFSDTLHGKADDLFDLTLESVIEQRTGTGQGAWFLVNSSFYAIDAVKIFSKGRWRVAVYSRNALVSVVSQTTIMAFLEAHWATHFKSIHVALSKTGLINDHVCAVQSTDRTGLVYAMMVHNRISAVAVLAGTKLVGQLSTMDALSLTAENVDDLSLPVGEFLARAAPTREPLLVCRESASLHQVVKLFAQHKSHRVWVVGGMNGSKLVGMVSLTAFFRALLPAEESR